MSADGRAAGGAGLRAVYEVLDRVGVVARRVRAVGSPSADENANWHVWPVAGERSVLRRYHRWATAEELAYEHRILDRLADAGWTVPHALCAPIEHEGRWFCLTAFVPGRPRNIETVAQRRQRVIDLARLNLALRPLAPAIGQRPGWRAVHEGATVHAQIDWSAGIAALCHEHPRLADWAQRASEATATELARLGAGELPVTLLHGDFTESNVHYKGTALAGVVDFALAHLDSRPFELAIARTYRAPEMRDPYREEIRRCGWPLTELEEDAIEPIDRAFRVDMVAWQIHAGAHAGRFDIEMIERQLRRTGVAALA